MIAIVAIVVAGAVTLIGVQIAARQTRGARIQDRRTDAYVRILGIAYQITVQAGQHALFPGKAFEDDPERLLERQAGAEMAIMGSADARQKYELWQQQVSAYWPLVHTAETAFERATELEGDFEKWDVAHSDAEKARMKLILPMEVIRNRMTDLEEILRKESQSKGKIRP